VYTIQLSRAVAARATLPLGFFDKQPRKRQHNTSALRAHDTRHTTHDALYLHFGKWWFQAGPSNIGAGMHGKGVEVVSLDDWILFLLSQAHLALSHVETIRGVCVCCQ
jgi:hypothetical protein